MGGSGKLHGSGKRSGRSSALYCAPLALEHMDRRGKGRCVRQVGGQQRGRARRSMERRPGTTPPTADLTGRRDHLCHSLRRAPLPSAPRRWPVRPGQPRRRRPLRRGRHADRRTPALSRLPAAATPGHRDRADAFRSDRLDLRRPYWPVGRPSELDGAGRGECAAGRLPAVFGQPPGRAVGRRDLRRLLPRGLQRTHRPA